MPLCQSMGVTPASCRKRRDQRGEVPQRVREVLTAGGDRLVDESTFARDVIEVDRCVAAHVDAVVTVSEEALSKALLLCLERAKLIVEPAGVAAVAALMTCTPEELGLTGPVCAVLSGGNIDPLLLASIIERGMVRAGRLARIRVGARDAPGVLARITAIVAEAGANIDEVHHQRAFSSLSVQSVEVELVLQTRNRAHVQDVVAQLAAAGFEAVSA